MSRSNTGSAPPAFRGIVLLIASTVWAALPAAPPDGPSPAPELRIGAAAVVITPPLGIPLAGYYHERGAAGVHDDLHAKAIVLESGGARAALVALDLIATRRATVEEARRLIERDTGIPAAHVMVSATHAHTGPVLADGSPRAADLGGASPLAIEYSRALPALIARSVAEAAARLAPAEAHAAIGREETLAFNRRFHMTDGTVGWNPGKLNPRILRPAGPMDPDVPVVFFRAPATAPAAGATLAAYVNFAMHLDTVGGLEISADYPYALSESLRRVLGPELVTVFTAGSCGDINHIDVSWAAPQKGHAEAARIGCVLAGAVIATLPRAARAGDGKLQCLVEMVPLPIPEISEEDLAAARATLERRGRGESVPFLDAVAAYKVLDVAARAGKPLEVEVQVIALGDDLAWVSLPGEIFVELGIAIRRASPFRYTAIAELANGSVGYVPTRHAYTQGNYEVVSARCAAGSGELLVEAACRLLRAAHRAAARPAE